MTEIEWACILRPAPKIPAYAGVIFTIAPKLFVMLVSLCLSELYTHT